MRLPAKKKGNFRIKTAFRGEKGTDKKEKRRGKMGIRAEGGELQVFVGGPFLWEGLRGGKE